MLDVLLAFYFIAAPSGIKYSCLNNGNRYWQLNRSLLQLATKWTVLSGLNNYPKKDCRRGHELWWSSPTPAFLFATDHRHAQKAWRCYLGINLRHESFSQAGKREFSRTQQVWTVPLWVASRFDLAGWRQTLLTQRNSGGALHIGGVTFLGDTCSKARAEVEPNLWKQWRSGH